MEPYTPQQPQPGYWQRQKEKFSQLTDILMFFVSIAATFIIYIEFKDLLPDVGWPYFLDKILCMLIIFLLCLVLAYLLKWPITIGLAAVSLFYLCTWGIRLVNGEYKNRASQTHAYSNEDNGTFNQKMHHFFMDFTGVQAKLDSQQAQIQLLSMEIDSLKNQAKPDSIVTSQ